VTTPHPERPEKPLASQPPQLSPRRGAQSFGEFVALMAAMQALNAAAIDTMLPALPLIGRDFAVTDENRLQWIIAAFVIGSGFGQLIYGPLSDRFGRRPILLTAMCLYVVLSLLTSLAPDLNSLIALRVLQGFSVAATSVVSRSVVRDCYSGAAMARVLSMIYFVFLMVPIAAPSVGQVFLLFVSWRGVFGSLALLGVVVAVWAAVRLPETLKPENRRSLAAAHLLQAARFVLSEPSSVLYTMSLSLMFGSLLAYVSTVPQIFAGVFHAPQLLGPTFAACASAMGVATFVNGRLVERLGMHAISHTALVVFILVTSIHAAIAWSGAETLLTFAILQAITLACFPLAASNFGAIAMQPMGAIAGSAASLQGVISTIGGAAVGSFIGHQWSGSVFFLPAGSACCGVIAFALVLAAERARLFRHPGGTR
jgi:MFS transporter, DHA1 family, multidrug resistance protein